MEEILLRKTQETDLLPAARYVQFFILLNGIFPVSIKRYMEFPLPLRQAYRDGIFYRKHHREILDHMGTDRDNQHILRAAVENGSPAGQGITC